MLSLAGLPSRRRTAIPPAPPPVAALLPPNRPQHLKEGDGSPSALSSRQNVTAAATTSASQSALYRPIPAPRALSRLRVAVFLILEFCFAYSLHSRSQHDLLEIVQLLALPHSQLNLYPCSVSDRLAIRSLLRRFTSAHSCFDMFYSRSFNGSGRVST